MPGHRIRVEHDVHDRRLAGAEDALERGAEVLCALDVFRVPAEDLAGYLEGKDSPPASLMVRMSRLSERFAKMKAHRTSGGAG